MRIKVEITEKGLVQTQTEEQGPPTLKVNGFTVGGVVQTRTPEGEITTIQISGTQWDDELEEEVPVSIPQTYILYRLIPSDVGNMVKLEVPAFLPEDFTYEEMESFAGIMLLAPTGADCPVNSVIRIMYDYSFMAATAAGLSNNNGSGNGDGETFIQFPFTIPFFPGALFFPDENNEFSVGEPASAQDVEYGIRISPKAMIDIMKTRVIDIDSSLFEQASPPFFPGPGAEGNLRIHVWAALNESSGIAQ